MPTNLIDKTGLEPDTPTGGTQLGNSGIYRIDGAPNTYHNYGSANDYRVPGPDHSPSGGFGHGKGGSGSGDCPPKPVPKPKPRPWWQNLLLLILNLPPTELTKEIEDWENQERDRKADEWLRRQEEKLREQLHRDRIVDIEKNRPPTHKVLPQFTPSPQNGPIFPPTPTPTPYIPRPIPREPL